MANPTSTIREQTELIENATLCKSASLASSSKGRILLESKCTLRTDFQRDRDRILHSNAFRRLKHKTQVFLVPVGDHYRTRLTHTLEVSQIARTISRALRLNEDLTEAIAMGHDLGHTPFGHTGEDVLNQICSFGFKHYLQSIRVVHYIENNGKGLNLTFEVKNGIACHTNQVASTKEGNVVRLADKIAYINHDIDDAIRAGVLNVSQLPLRAIKILGNSKSRRITTLVQSVINNGTDTIAIEPNIKVAHDELRTFMFENVYTNSIAKAEEQKARQLIEKLFEYFYKNPHKLPSPYKEILEKYGIERAVCDYIAGMSDGYAINLYSELFIPKGWMVK